METENADVGSGLDSARSALLALRMGPKLLARLQPEKQTVAEVLYAAIIREVGAFSASGNPEVLPDLKQHIGDYLSELTRLLGGGDESPSLAFVRSHAARRAAQRFPLEATLLAYRLSHGPLSSWLAGAAAGLDSKKSALVRDAAEVLLREFESAASIVFAAAYVAETRILAEAEGDRRTELLRILVSGYDESDARVARLLKRAGYLEQRRSFSVVLAQSTDPLEMEHPACALRIVEVLSNAVAGSGIRALVGLRGNVVTAVFSDVRRTSGWTAPQAKLAERLQPRLLELGPAVLVGLSSDQPSTAFIPRGLQEATVALDFASVTDRVVPFSALPIRRLLIHRGADYVQSAMPVWFPSFKDADTKAKGTLVETLRALADADMNIQLAARRLTVHANTIYARLQRIRELTGLDAQRYHDLTDLLLAADCSPR